MQLGKISKGTASATVAAPAKAATEPAAATAEPGRALVTVAPAVNAAELIANNRNAPFLAQLIATKDQHPQTRERRRAEPEEAAAAYRAAAALIT